MKRVYLVDPKWEASSGSWLPACLRRDDFVCGGWCEGRFSEEGEEWAVRLGFAELQFTMGVRLGPGAWEARGVRESGPGLGKRRKIGGMSAAELGAQRAVSKAESARRAAARMATDEELSQRPECLAPLPAGWWGRQGVGCKEEKDRKLAEGFVRDLVLAEGRFPSGKGGRPVAGSRVEVVRRVRARLVCAGREAKAMWAQVP